MRRFSIHIIIRILLLALVLSPVGYLWFEKRYLMAGIFVLISGLVSFSIYKYVTAINYKLARFFDSIQYADFTVKYSSDNKLGHSFKDLNKQMNLVIDAFKTARAEKEANIHYLNTLVQHIDVGIICFDANGTIEILNNAAIRLLNIYRLRNLIELEKGPHRLLHEVVKNLGSGERFMYNYNNGVQLAVNATKVSLRGKAVKIISLQNIRTELQEKELDAWQNLTKVLRHEIMNSIAPIVSLVGTMRNIVDEDLTNRPEIADSVIDLSEALKTIETRGTGIMNFVNAYRDFTTLPKPVFKEWKVSETMNRIEKLVTTSGKEKNVAVKFEILTDFTITCDIDQIEMVLINLVKNAFEVLEDIKNPQINIRAYQDSAGHFLEVVDNGPGIIPEALEKIFIPFYTTKKSGQGIGLSLSKQILQMHRGNLSVQSEYGNGTIFRLEFQ